MTEQDSYHTRVASIMSDPSAHAVARVYATAYLNAAKSEGTEDPLEELSSFLDDVLAQYPEFAHVLLSAMINRDEKLALIERAVAPFGSEMFTSFLRVLARHDRLELLPLILNESRTEFEARQGKKRVQVTSARPLSDASREAIRNRLRDAFSFEPIIEDRTDPKLLGGLTIRVGDRVYDSSLRTRLKQLQIQMRERSLNEIQSGRNRFSHPEGD
jgi:F-type H+-transporting ATPase subunit delta